MISLRSEYGNVSRYTRRPEDFVAPKTALEYNIGFERPEKLSKEGQHPFGVLWMRRVSYPLAVYDRLRALCI